LDDEGLLISGIPEIDPKEWQVCSVLNDSITGEDHKAVVAWFFQLGLIRAWVRAVTAWFFQLGLIRAWVRAVMAWFFQLGLSNMKRIETPVQNTDLLSFQSVSEMSSEEMARLLQFSTGLAHIPAGIVSLKRLQAPSISDSWLIWSLQVALSHWSLVLR